MTEKYDFLLDSDMDLQENPITHDLVEGESTKQHQQLLLLLPKGSVKENPDVGVGLVNYLEGEDSNEMFAEIKRQFYGDGMQINSMGFDDKGQLLIDANYK